jgi:hypothetical protein
LNTESSQIKIKKGDLPKITYKGNQALESSVHVENNILVFDKIQPGIQVEIEVPDLKQVELGGNASTEIEGFTPGKNDIFPLPIEEIQFSNGNWQQNPGYN